MINKVLYIVGLKDPFDLLKKIDVSTDSAIRTNAASAYRFFLAVGIIGLVYSLIIAGAKLASNRSSDKKNNVKESISFKLKLAIFFFGFITIAGLVYGAIITMVE